jgi:hypothetical protein
MTDQERAERLMETIIDLETQALPLGEEPGTENTIAAEFAAVRAEERAAAQAEIEQLREEAMLDPAVLCEAAGGDWCLEHYDAETPTRDVLLAVLAEQTKDKRRLRGELAHWRDTVEVIAVKGLGLPPITEDGPIPVEWDQAGKLSEFAAEIRRERDQALSELAAAKATWTQAWMVIAIQRW